ncbi:probable cytochrome P450 6a17 [Vespa velutina]|uniref:probable cytochrome P450 6a17 n=1 Tax=Vespa velutina TaxID=202808 RepID=UPI001FB282EF|nr:probable cytochrome P450 6a17 [Vespa velutina]XP_047356735.1 probable cytochrome P450 6a17 [Vespa velutina]XP_047356737.1 probable cytochrome P450 6a17 [Vespa velutina]XP_047356738.1 probable cytochrome P450 6a17 [Vespa velutina]
MAGIFEILCGLTLIIFFLYYYLTSTFDYWKVRGVKGPQPIPLFGNIKDILFYKINMAEYLSNIYHFYKDEPCVGIFFRSKPVLMLRDPQLIKDILIKDFSSFPQRGIVITKKIDPLSENLVFLEALRWRPLRNKLTTVFTSVKLKEMFPLMKITTDHLEQYINKIPDNYILNINELNTKYIIEMITRFGFGMETNIFNDGENEFLKVAKKISENNIINLLKQNLQIYFPKLYDQLGFLFKNVHLTSFFVNTVKNAIEYRIKNNIVRNDFINLMMELKKNSKNFSEEIELTDIFFGAQAFMFFIAGFETSSLAMTFTLYELAQNHNIQDEVRKEINEVFEQNNGTLNIESIKDLKYLHASFKEALRKYPPITYLHRECTIPSYTLKGTNITIQKNQQILIPILGLHYDPKIYLNPNVFDPKRFMTKNNGIKNEMYLPFGTGPRNCYGEKFALYQTTLGLATLLRNCKVDICEKTKIPFTHLPSHLFLRPAGGIYLKISKINEK